MMLSQDGNFEQPMSSYPGAWPENPPTIAGDMPVFVAVYRDLITWSHVITNRPNQATRNDSKADARE
ncbi:hypothetical protein N7478_005499 [Penicillium angulare]|uniref:uncharacterized protein n=1 Tax=Penicillium angulare TaxID=116970 RepID=UPI0025416183|nr:uncharacterized protein N7478_005499 [Penicillium angulare]KAJ5280127.1 hypothetical protein N7478_005499 [Penicillium angulare]